MTLKMEKDYIFYIGDTKLTMLSAYELWGKFSLNNNKLISTDTIDFTDVEFDGA